MKKFYSTIFAMMAAAGIMYGAQVESINTVGVDTKTAVAGFNFFAPQFTNIGENVCNIKRIVLQGDNVTSFGDSIQVLDEGGAIANEYYWGAKEDSGLEGDGWMTEDGSDLADFDFDQGQTLLISTQNEDVEVALSGEVNKDSVSFDTVPGFNFYGNCFAAPLSIKDIIISGEVTSFGDSIQILDEGGAVASEYYWGAKEDSGLEDDGWMTEDGSGLSDLELQPGQGLLISIQNEGVRITVNNPLK